MSSGKACRRVRLGDAKRSGRYGCRADGGRCGAVAEPRPDAVERARPSGYLAARLCPCSDGHSAVFCLSAAETKAWVALEGVADCCSWHFWASAWCGQQGERFVAVDHRRCIRMPFVPPCLMYNLSILQKRCATNGSARQKLGKRYERRKTQGLKNHLPMRPMSARPSDGGNNERQTVPFVPKTAPFVLQFCLRSSCERRCCAKAVS